MSQKTPAILRIGPGSPVKPGYDEGEAQASVIHSDGWYQVALIHGDFANQ